MRGLLIAPVLLFSLGVSAQVVGGFANAGGFGASSPTNNPVSLVVERKQVQTLADGTHITSTTHQYFYRDTLGRTRTEDEFGAFAKADQKIRGVSVNDPVAGVRLNWQTGGTQTNLREYSKADIAPQNGAMRRLPQPPVRSPGSMPPSNVAQQAVDRPRLQRKEEDLGMRDVQAFPCHATRITTTIPIGMIGNDRPITSTEERCMSAELGRTLEEIQEDPRTGTRTMTVQSLTRGEPDPSLFLPPADYRERIQPAR